MKEGQEGPQRRGRVWQSAIRTSAVGLEIGLAVLFGYLIGSWIDGQLGTEPYLMITCLVLGWIAGMRNLYRAARRVLKEQEDDDGP